MFIEDSEYALKNHGATDLGRYDYLTDIKRLELLFEKNNKEYKFNKRLKNCKKGYAIILTNDHLYWDKSRLNTNALYKNFCISTNDEIKAGEILSWNKSNKLNKDGKYSCVDGTFRDYDLVFNNNYAFVWKEYTQGFKYLTNEIEME